MEIYEILGSKVFKLDDTGVYCFSNCPAGIKLFEKIEFLKY